MDRDAKVSMVTSSSNLPLSCQRSKITTGLFEFYMEHNFFLSGNKLSQPCFDGIKQNIASQAPVTTALRMISIWPHFDLWPGHSGQKYGFAMKCFFSYRIRTPCDDHMVWSLHLSKVSTYRVPGWGVLKFDLVGDVPPKLRNPYTFLRVIFAPQKVLISKNFPQNIGLFFKIFGWGGHFQFESQKVWKIKKINCLYTNLAEWYQ